MSKGKEEPSQTALPFLPIISSSESQTALWCISARVVWHRMTLGCAADFIVKLLLPLTQVVEKKTLPTVTPVTKDPMEDLISLLLHSHRVYLSPLFRKSSQSSQAARDPQLLLLSEAVNRLKAWVSLAFVRSCMQARDSFTCYCHSPPTSDSFKNVFSVWPTLGTAQSQTGVCLYLLLWRQTAGIFSMLLSLLIFTREDKKMVSARLQTSYVNRVFESRWVGEIFYL